LAAAAFPTTDLFNPDPYQPYSYSVQRTGAYTDTTARSQALYAFDTVDLNEQWSVMGGLRWDRFSAESKSVSSTFTGNAVTNVNRVDKMVSWRGSVSYKPAPDGNIYFHPHAGGWSEDFANEPLFRQGFFIHEMTHVWQAQKGGRLFLPLMRHPFCRYRYSLTAGKPFRRYGLEQQAEIVRHRFLADRGAAVASAPPADLLPFGR